MNWNDESLKALSSWQLFEWWSCKHATSLSIDAIEGEPLIPVAVADPRETFKDKIPLIEYYKRTFPLENYGRTTRCQLNPAAYVFHANTAIQMVIRMLEFISGVIVVLWIIGEGSVKKSIQHPPIPGYLFLWVIFSLVGVVLDTNIVRSWTTHIPEGIPKLLGIFLLFPLSFGLVLIGLFTLAMITLVSIPVLVLTYSVSEVLGAILPDKPTLSFEVGAFLTMIYHCAGKSVEGSVHEFLHHTIFKIFGSLRLRP